MNSQFLGHGPISRANANTEPTSTQFQETLEKSQDLGYMGLAADCKCCLSVCTKVRVTMEMLASPRNGRCELVQEFLKEQDVLSPSSKQVALF